LLTSQARWGWIISKSCLVTGLKLRCHLMIYQKEEFLSDTN